MAVTKRTKKQESKQQQQRKNKLKSYLSHSPLYLWVHRESWAQIRTKIAAFSKPSGRNPMKTRTPKRSRRYAERKTKDTLPSSQSDAHLSSPRACRQTGTTWRQQDSCSTPCSARLSFLQCGYTQHTSHTGFPQTHWWNWRGDAATYSILTSGSLERTFCGGVLSVHSCLSPSAESPPECGVWCGRQRSGENMKCCVLLMKILLWLMMITTMCSARNSTMFNWLWESIYCLLRSEAA